MFSESGPMFNPPRDVLRHDSVEDVRTYKDNLRLRRKAQSLARGEPQPPTYAFTELITMRFPPGKADVVCATADEGQAFAEYVRVVLETLQGMSLLRWGFRIEAPEIVIVLLDWESLENWKTAQQQAHLLAAKSALELLLKEPISSRAFDFRNADRHNNCFGQRESHVRTGNIDTAFYLWEFPQPMRDAEFVLPPQNPTTETPLDGTDARYYEVVESSVDADGTLKASSREEDTAPGSRHYTRSFELHWEHFALQYYRDGAYANKSFSGPNFCCLFGGHWPTWGGGWEVLPHANGVENGERAYCGVIGTLHDISAPYLKKTLGKSYEEGGLEPLQSLATAGLDIFHVELHNLTSWQGSVVPTPPPTNLTSMTLGNPPFGGARGEQQPEGEKERPTSIFGKW